jgi:TetR/AcrR family transcriptional regulator
MAEGEGGWASRKLGAESSATRAALIDAAEQLMCEEGYAAVTSRRIASKAGLKPQLVHYYFRGMDELYLAVLRRGAEANLRRLAAALETDQPLRGLWEFMRDPRGTAFISEFTALASHHEVIRAEMARYAEQFRRMQMEAISRHLDARGVTPRIPPVVVSVLMVSLSGVLARENALGIGLGHAETEALVELCLRQFEETGEAPAAPISRPSSEA